MNLALLTADLLRNGPCARASAPYRLVEVRGPDAGEFLHRLCTQDVVGLADGQVRPAAFLDAKGKLLVTCLVFRLGDSFWLEVQQEQEERLVALLERYHFTEKLTVVPQQPADCREIVMWGRNTTTQDRAGRVDGLVVVFERRGILFTRLHRHPLEMVHADTGATVRTQPMSAALAECLRMCAGLVRVGVETEPSTLALEADLEDHCSTTKGCYTGQEIVARIHTYGHVNRKLCLLHLAAGPVIDAPQPLHELEDKLAVGRVMHAVTLPDGTGRLGVGYLPQDFQALGTKLALACGSAVEVIGYEPLTPDLPA